MDQDQTERMTPFDELVTSPTLQIMKLLIPYTPFSGRRMLASFIKFIELQRTIRLFGGMLMQWLDEVAGMVAKRHTRANVITASVDNLRFIHGAYKGEMVVIVGKVTYVGTTSMEVRVDTYVEHMEDGMRRPINRAYFTMVALDEDDKPKQVPRLILETEAQRAEWKAAEKRREMRMRRKEEGF